MEWGGRGDKLVHRLIFFPFSESRGLGELSHGKFSNSGTPTTDVSTGIRLLLNLPSDNVLGLIHSERRS